MKRLFIILILPALTCVVACDNKCNCSSKNVCVAIINSTGQPIETVRLLTHGIKIVESKQLAIDDKTCISFKSPGENTFSLTAILSNGDTVISADEYSEGGYKFIGTVTKNKIKIEYNNFY